MALFIEGLPDHVRSCLRGIVEKALSLFIANNGVYSIPLFPAGDVLQVVSGNLVFPFDHLHTLPLGFLSALGHEFFSGPYPHDSGEESTLPNAIENLRAPKDRCFSQVLFNPEKLVVFGHPVAAAGRTRFDLPYIGGYCQVGDESVFRLA